MADPGVEDWVEHTTKLERVRSIAISLTRPRSASWIGSEAHVPRDTAKEHLNQLVTQNVLLEQANHGTVMYKPNPAHMRAQSIRDLLDWNSRKDLLEKESEIQERLGESDGRQKALLRYRLKLVQDAIGKLDK